jgi:flagellar motor switch protein FliG
VSGNMLGLGRLPGPAKAALVILGLEDSVASEILRHLEERELKRLAEAADALDPIPMDALDPVLEEFERRMHEPVPPRGGGKYLRKLTESALGQDKAHKLFAPAAPASTNMEALRGARASTIAEILEDEHPQVAALIVSQLPRDQAAKVLLAMPSDRQVDLVARVASLKELPAQALQVASEALVKALGNAAGSSEAERREFDGVSFAAGLLNELPPGETERLLGSLDDTNAKLAPKIRDAMFTFEDLVRLDKRAAQLLMREIAGDKLLIALKTASEALREHFLAAVSSRAAQTMREDLSLLPPTRLSDVEEAQRGIVETATRLAAEGKLQLPGNTQEKLV